MTTTTYTAQQALAAAANGTLTTPVAILDSSSAVQPDLDALKPLAVAGEIASISFSDFNPSMVLQGPQAISDLQVLSLFQGSYSLYVTGTTVSQTQQLHAALSQATFEVYDSGATIAANLGALQAAASQIQSITCNDAAAGNLVLTQAQLAADPAIIAKLVPGDLTLSVSGTFTVAQAAAAELLNGYMQGLAVVDSAANLEAGLKTLTTRPGTYGLQHTGSNPYQLASVTLTDSGTPTIVVADTSYSNEQGFIQAITNTHSVDWTGVPINQVATILTQLGQPSSLAGLKVEISDVGASVSSALDDLLPYNQQIGSITITDGNLPTFTAAQATSDASILAKITVADIPAAAAVVEAGQLAALKGVLVQDSAAHVAASLDGLESLAMAGKLEGIALTGSGTQTLTITAAQQTSDAAALAAIQGPYQIQIGQAGGGTGTTPPTVYSIQQFLAAAAQGTLAASASILDGAQGVQSDLDALNPYAIAGEITSISFNDTGTPTVSVQASQAISDLKVLSLFQGSYNLEIDGASVVQTEQLAAAFPQVSIGVFDSAANIAGALDSLQALASKLSYIDVDYQSTGTLTLTQAQLAADSAAVAKLYPNQVTLTIAGTFSVAQAVAAEDVNAWIQGLTVVDSLANLQAALPTMPTRPGLSGPGEQGTNPYQLVSVTLTDSGTPTLVEPYTLAENGFLRAITNPHYLDWTDVPIGQVAGLLNSPGQLSSLLGSKVEIWDVGATVSSALDALLPYQQAGQIGSITITDGNLPTFSAAQATADASVLANITVADTPAAAAVAEASQLQPLHGVIVQDNAAHVAASLDGLESIAAAGKLAGITLVGATDPMLTVSATQLTSDASALAAITGTYQLDVTPVTGVTIKGVSGVATTVDILGNAADYSFTPAGNGSDLTVTGDGGTYQMGGIQAVQFSDHQVIVAATPGPASAVTTGNITEIYGAVFGREPDVGGLAFYQSYLAANPGTPLTQFAQFFLASPEYVNNPAHNYAQSTAGDAQFITDSYQNLLGRTPSATEVTFYQNVIAPFIQGLTPGTTAYTNAETQAHALVLTYFSQSPEFLGDVQITAANPASAQHWLVLI